MLTVVHHDSNVIYFHFAQLKDVFLSFASGMVVLVSRKNTPATLVDDLPGRVAESLIRKYLPPLLYAGRFNRQNGQI